MEIEMDMYEADAWSYIIGGILVGGILLLLWVIRKRRQ